MRGARKSKTSVRGSTPDLGSVNDANIAPGLGAVSTSNIIAGGRTRKAASTNDDRSGQKGGAAPIDASSSPSKVTKNAQEKKGKRLGTMLADRGEDSRKKDSMMTAAPTPTVAAAAGTVIYQNSYEDTEAPAEAQKKRGKCLKTMLADQGEDSRKKDSMMTAAPTPSVAAAAGTLIYQNQYGVTDAPPVALASDEEVDYMTDGNTVISQSSKEPGANKIPTTPWRLPITATMLLPCQEGRRLARINLAMTKPWQAINLETMTPLGALITLW